MFELFIEITQFKEPKHPNQFLFACYQMCETTPEKLVVFPTLAACEKERANGVAFFKEQKALQAADRLPDGVMDYRLTCRRHRPWERLVG